MDSPPLPPQKKGLGPLAWIGLGCGAMVALFVVAAVAIGIFFGPKLKQLGEDMQKDPTRTMATTMVSVSAGQLEIVAQDEANKRYTLRQKSSGQLTTVYWDARQGKAAVINGDFSAIPPEPSSTATPSPN